MGKFHILLLNLVLSAVLYAEVTPTSHIKVGTSDTGGEAGYGQGAAPDFSKVPITGDKKASAEALKASAGKAEEVAKYNQDMLKQARESLEKQKAEAERQISAAGRNVEKGAEGRAALEKLEEQEKELKKAEVLNANHFKSINDARQQADALTKAVTASDGTSGSSAAGSPPRPNGIGGGGSEQLPTAKGDAQPTQPTKMSGLEFRGKEAMEAAKNGAGDATFTNSPPSPPVGESKGYSLPDNVVGPRTADSFTGPDGKNYQKINEISDGDTPGTKARYYSRDGGETGYRVGGNGEVHHMERMANGEYLLGTVQNGSAAIGKVGGVPTDPGAFSNFTPRTDMTNLSREQFIGTAPSSKSYSPDVLTRLPPTSTTNPSSATKGPASSASAGSPARAPAASTASEGYWKKVCDGKTCKMVFVPTSP